MNNLNNSDNGNIKRQRYWGAKPEEWAFLNGAGDLIANVLPIIANRGLLPAPTDAKKDIRGKAPSLKGAFGAYYMRGWTTHITTQQNINTWSQDPDYGYGYRTGNNDIIAIDCDCDDAEISRAVRAKLGELLGYPINRIPTRTRGNARWATLLQVQGQEDIVGGKTVLKINDNNTVELRGKGHQLAICGTHPCGARYTWNTSPFPVVSLSPLALTELIQFITAELGAQSTTNKVSARVKGTTYKANDRLAQWLLANWRVLDIGMEGELYIECPWGSEHTGGLEGSHIQDTAYFPVGSNGYDQGGFKCLHAHCAHRTVIDLIAWAKSKGYTVTEANDYPDESQNNQKANTEEEALERASVVALAPWYNEVHATYISTPTSVYTALSYPNIAGIRIAYDTFTQAVLVKDYPEGKEWRGIRDTDNLHLRINLENRGFTSKGLAKELIKDIIEKIAEDNTFDSMKEWLDINIPAWDGIDRISDFFANYCGTSHGESSQLSKYHTAAAQYFFTALWARAHTPAPTKADIALVLVGGQGAKKSSVVEALAIKDDWATEINFEVKDDDNIRSMQGRILAELPELRGMNRKDVTAVKAFLSKKSDTWVKKWHENATKAPRRCVFIMTTNEGQFLTDTTGNRRYAPVEMGVIKLDNIKEDVLQLYAQARELYKQYGIMYQGVERYGSEVVKKYEEEDPWEQPIIDFLSTADNNYPNEPLTTNLILFAALKLDVSKYTKIHANHVGGIMRKLGYTIKPSKRDENGKRLGVWVKQEQ